MPSTVIRSYEYRAGSRELLVTFVTGRRYRYADVPEEVARQLRMATSKGSFFNRRIRDRYPFEKLSGD